MIQGWGLIVPGCGGTSSLSRGETLTASWRHQPQLIIHHPVEVSGFPRLAERYRPEDCLFLSLGC